MGCWVSAAQQVLKDDRLVVLRVFGTVEQGGGAFGDGLFEKSQLHGVIFQFSLIASFELGPFCGVVREPLAKIVARGYLLQPQVYVSFFFGEAAWPEAVDEDAGAIGFGGGFIDTFELNNHGRSVTFRWGR